MFFKYKRKCKNLQIALDKTITSYDSIVNILTEENNKLQGTAEICSVQYQSMFKDYRDAIAIIDTIKEIRSDKAFTGKQGKEIDKLIN